MAINKKLIHFQTLANFEAQLSAGNILDTSICFIKDANKIWTHGQFYDCDVQIMNDGGEGRVVLGHNNQTIYPYTLASQVQAGSSDLDTYLNNLATVATSGSYNDLADKPTIPSAVTESTVSGWGFTKNTGTYSKPSSGIPKTDLASGVQSSLEKADKAQPTLVSGTNIKTINGESILGSGDISISSTPVDETDPIFTASPASSITNANITSWNNKLDKLNTYYGTSSTTAYTSTKDVTCSGYALTTGNRIAVKFSNRNTATSVYLNVNSTGAKQVYFRGAPIKAGFWDDGCVLDFVYDGTFYQVVGGVTRSKITYTSSTTSVALTAGNYYYWSSVGSKITITSISGYLNMLDPTQIVLTIGSTVPTITLPSGIKWVNGAAPVPVANSVLEISIFEDRATYSIFK